MGQGMVDAFVLRPGGTDFSYRTTAEANRMIASIMVPVIIALDPEAQAEIARLGLENLHSGPIARALQSVTLQVPERARSLSVQNGLSRFRGEYHGIRLHVRGWHGLFTRPEPKAERHSYDVMTPSTARGIPEAVHWKAAISWVIDRFHAQEPIRFPSIPATRWITTPRQAP